MNLSMEEHKPQRLSLTLNSIHKRNLLPNCNSHTVDKSILLNEHMAEDRPTVFAQRASSQSEWAARIDPANYLLSGDSELSFLLTGTQIEDVSEHCEGHSADGLRSLQLKFASMSVEDIMSGFRVDDFNDRNIYTGGDEWTKDMAPYVAEHLESFLKKLRELVDSELGMMVIIC